MQVALIQFVNFTVGEIKLMLTATPWKKLSQVTATATLSVAVLAAVTSPASAVNIKEFQLTGTFANQAQPGASGLIAQLAGGSFDGTYKVDIDQLPVSQSSPLVPLTSWNIKLRDSSNTILRTLSDQVFNSFGLVTSIAVPNKDSLEFDENQAPILRFILPFNPGFTGIGTGQLPFYGSLTRQGQGTILVASSNSVPEPFTVGGTLVASAIGLWMKSKSKKSSLSV